jgi:hypothetical protein
MLPKRKEKLIRKIENEVILEVLIARNEGKRKNKFRSLYWFSVCSQKYRRMLKGYLYTS